MMENAFDVCLKPAPLAEDRQEDKLRWLTDEQLDVLAKLDENKRAAVEGCAGSGKTLIALAKATTLARSGHKTLLTCYNRALADQLSAIAGDTENLEILAFHALCEREIEATSRATRKDDAIKLYSTFYPMLLRQAMHENPERRFDAIVVDEGQDFCEVFWSALMNKCLNDPETGHFYIFFDDEQKLVRTEYQIPAFDVRLKLTKNLRNTAQIFNAWSKICEPYSQYQSVGTTGRSIEHVTYESEEYFLETLNDVICNLIQKDKVALSEVIVLLPMRDQDLIGKRLACGIELTSTREKTNGLMVSTIAKFKGLEQSVVIVAGLDSLQRVAIEEKRSRLYIGMSRARNHLILMGTLAGFDQIRSCIRKKKK